MSYYKKPNFRIFTIKWKQARELAGLSQVQLAALMGVRPLSISAWEMGRRTPSAITFLHFLEITGTPLEFFKDVTVTPITAIVPEDDI